MTNQLAAYDAADAAIAGPIIYPLSLGNNIGAIDPGASIDFSYGIAGVGFLSAAGVENPYQRGLSNVLKEQINNSEQPGDQSFTNWWLRSQTDWSGGAGTLSMEPVTDVKVQRSFYSSFGVDVWTPGEVTLLPSMTNRITLSPTSNSGVHFLALNVGYYLGVGTQAWHISSAFASTAITGISSGEIVTGFSTGNGRVYISTNTAVYVLNSGTTSASKIFIFPAVDIKAKAFFVKDRLLMASAGALWDQAPPVSGAPVVTLAYVNALYRRDADYAWVSAATGPNFIIVAGSCACDSSLYSIKLDTTGVLPVLASPTVVAEFPNNEIVRHIASYLGAYLAISTTLGIRIGTISADSVVYGPRLTAPVSTGPFAAFDRFLFYPTVDAGEQRTGVIRVDLSDIDTTGRAAWAADARVPAFTAGNCKAVSVAGNGSVVMINDRTSQVDVYASAAALEPIGFFSTSDIQLGTTEKKYFDGINLQLDPSWAGNVTVTAQTDDGSVGLVGAITNASGNDVELKINQLEPASKIALGFTLRANEEGDAGPIVQSWQLRSLPSVKRQRLIKVPLLCFDHERDTRGAPYGYEGYAIARWRALEEQSRGSWPFTYQDLQTGETYRVILEAISFNQTVPPTNASGFGGVIDLTVRVIS